MNSAGENKLKIRFRLPNGEEFEAEGPQTFIEDQRNYFLTLIGVQATPHPAVSHNTNPSAEAAPTAGGLNSPATEQRLPYNRAPHIAPRQTTPYIPAGPDIPGRQLANSVQPPKPTPSQAQELSAEFLFWERIFKQENDVLVLRHKAKLAPHKLAVLLLAGARVILQKDTYSALELAKSFKASGGPEGRLDRFLSTELQAGRIIAQGAKRSRTYHLSEEGFARAFVLADKLQK